ncbi:MAG: hypothetical protein HY904_11370 [Deltaproteobacteria bacterium]|nr:hypothetical protein [Deltaproteobacteria bacterium]
MRAVLTTWCAVWTLAACAATRPAATREAPADVTVADGRWRLHGREAASLRRERLGSRVHHVRLTPLADAPEVDLPALVPPTVVAGPRGTTAYVKVLLDDDVVAECAVRPDRLDAGHALQQAFAEVTGRATVVDTHATRLEVRVVAGWPVVLGAAEFLERGGHYGAVRLAAANAAERGVFCSTEARGHARTFAALVDALVRGLGGAGPDAARVFHRLEAAGGWAGFADTERRTREDGAHVEVTFVALVQSGLPVMHAVDEAWVEVAGPDGELQLARSLRREAGAVVRHQSVAHVRGRLQWHDEESGAARDLGAQAPASARALRAAYARLAAGEASPGVFLRWMPGMDATGLVEESLARRGRAGPGATLRATLQGASARAHCEFAVDQHGEVTQSRVAWDDGWLTLVRLGR